MKKYNEKVEANLTAIKLYCHMLQEKYDYVDPLFKFYDNLNEDGFCNFAVGGLLRNKYLVLVGNRIQGKLRYGVAWNLCEIFMDAINDSPSKMHPLFSNINCFFDLDQHFEIEMLKIAADPIIPTVLEAIIPTDSTMLTLDGTSSFDEKVYYITKKQMTYAVEEKSIESLANKKYTGKFTQLDWRYADGFYKLIHYIVGDEPYCKNSLRDVGLEKE